MKKTFIAAALALAATGAQALVTFPGSDAFGVTGSDNEFAPGIDLLYGREVVLASEARVTFTALFSEAAYTNAFLTIGNTTFSNSIDTGDSYTRDFVAGLLPFSFFVLNTGKSVVNGGNQGAWEAGANEPYFLVTPTTVNGSTETFFIGLNDDGGLIDDDYDDYVIRVDVDPLGSGTGTGTEVPEPAPAMLLGLGLIGMALTRLKGKKK